ncbi:Uncharacterised protein [Acinetobacter baumannii]|nr:Uncharacterised protein [Acinetobacter baumannii]
MLLDSKPLNSVIYYWLILEGIGATHSRIVLGGSHQLRVVKLSCIALQHSSLKFVTLTTLLTLTTENAI